MRKNKLLLKTIKLITFLCIITASAALALYLYSQTTTRPDVSESVISQNTTPSETVDTPDESLTYDDSPDIPSVEDTSRHSVTLMAVGDNLMHMGVVYTGRQSDGSLNYDFLFDDISEFLDTADIKIINQETIMGGNNLGFAGFPKFNSPEEVSDAIADAGFNVVLQASNHTADQGLEGIQNCISLWETHPEVLMVGLHDTESSDYSDDIPIINIDGINFAILNYTYGPNMQILPTYLQERLDMLCAYAPDSGVIDFTSLNPKVLEDIKKADEMADVVIVCPHWGTEYSSNVSKYQKTFALQMTEAGADLIIGTHPHVVEPIEWIQSDNGNLSLCFYSLGNYVSTQKQPICMLEAMAWVTFDIEDDEVVISPQHSGAIPLVCHYSSGPVRIRQICPLETYTEELASSHGIRNYGDAPLSLTELERWRDDILGDYTLRLDVVFDANDSDN